MGKVWGRIRRELDALRVIVGALVVFAAVPVAIFAAMWVWDRVDRHFVEKARARQ